MKSSYVALAAVGLTVGGLWYAAGSGTATPQAAAAEAARVSAPATHDNLTVYFIHGPDAVADEKVVTLQEALEKNWVVVHETGNVNVLAVENLSDDHDLFLQSGDMVKGGKQDRIVSTDLLVPPKSGRVALPAHCVEQSRWKQRKATEAADRFQKSDGQVCGKDLKIANIRQNQGAVWDNVALNQARLVSNTGVVVNDPESPTSLQLSLDNPVVRAKADSYVAALKDRADGRENVVGVVFVVNGQVSGAEVYGSARLFRKAWPKLLKSAAEEALADRTAAACPAPPTCREVELFLANAAKPDAPAAEDRAEVAAAGERGTPVPLGRSGSGRNEAEGEQAGRARIAAPSRTQQANVSHNISSGNHLANYYGNPSYQGSAGAAGFGNVLVVDNLAQVNDGRATGNRNPGRPQSTPAAVTQAAGNGNRLDVTRAENAKVLMLESRCPSQPAAVVHRSLLTK